MSMERVKEIASQFEWGKNNLTQGTLNVGDEDVQFLIYEYKRLTELVQDLIGEEVLHQDGIYETEMRRLKNTVKQQNEQIEEIAQSNKDYAQLYDKHMKQKDQRIEEYKQTTANQYQYIKELRDIFEEIKGEEEFTRGRVFELAEQALNK